MNNDKNIYTQRDYFDLHYTSSSRSTRVGKAVMEYEVRRFIDTKNLQSRVAYIIVCKQKFSIPNPTAYTVNVKPLTGFSNYPAMLISRAILNPGTYESMELLEYSPKTLNASVTSTSSMAEEKALTTSSTYSSGTSRSQSNTYSASANLGFFGDAITGGLEGGYSYQDGKSSSNSASQSSAASVSDQHAQSDTMSIKDWGCYAQLSNGKTYPKWIWAQEYPWNIMKYNSNPVDSTSGTNIMLPEFIQERLTDGYQVFPPSELSLLGIDFVSQAAWLVYPVQGSEMSDIKFDFTMHYYAASHELINIDEDGRGDLTASLVKNVLDDMPGSPLDLPALALKPIHSDAMRRKVGVVGFVPNKFDVAPSAGESFQIVSDDNDVLVRGSGFKDIMSADFPENAPATMNIMFKITDSSSDVDLMIKHWCTGVPGLTMNIVINGNKTIVRQINTFEGQGGESVVEKVSLRFKDFGSISYCDYLVIGMNTIDITVTKPAPHPDEPAAGYVVNALSIG